MSSDFSAVAVVWMESAAPWAKAGAIAGVQGGGLALANTCPVRRRLLPTPSARRCGPRC